MEFEDREDSSREAMAAGGAGLRRKVVGEQSDGIVDGWRDGGGGRECVVVDSCDGGQGRRGTEEEGENLIPLLRLRGDVKMQQWALSGVRIFDQIQRINNFRCIPTLLYEGGLCSVTCDLKRLI